MAANTQGVNPAFKLGLLKGTFDLQNHTIKLAVIFANSSVTASTNYATSGIGEVTANGTYTQGGYDLTATNRAPELSGSTAIWQPTGTGVSWTGVTWANPIDCAMLWDDSAADTSICVFTFPSVPALTAGNFALNYPTYDASLALIRIA